MSLATPAADVFSALAQQTAAGMCCLARATSIRTSRPDCQGQPWRVSGQTDLWQLTVSYEVISRSFVNAPEQPSLKSCPMSAMEISAEIRAEFFAYRANPNIPAGGDPEPNVNIEEKGSMQAAIRPA